MLIRITWDNDTTHDVEPESNNLEEALDSMRQLHDVHFISIGSGTYYPSYRIKQIDLI